MAIGSFVFLLIILHDAFEVMLLPRRVKSRLRVVRFFFRFSWLLWAGLARRIRSADKRHNCLSLYGPLSMVCLLMVWAGGLIVGFGILYWALENGPSLRTSWANQLYFSGVTFFTLGYGDLVPHTRLDKILVVAEAGIGLGFIATVIGYLPVLYQLFARREAKVIILDAAAGSPPSAMILLSRHAEGQSLRELEDLLHEWQQWSAELLESQLSYPMLAYYRSQHDNQSWLAALTAIMDCCALLMVGFKGVRTFQARLTFSTCRQAVMEMGRVFQVGVRPLEEDRLASANFHQLCANLAEVGLTFGAAGDAEEKLAAFRNTYEPFLNGLAHYLVLALPDWLAPQDQLDNWQNSPRGKSAKQLIEAVSPKPE
ncbi:MAG: potassium channel family protein [Acidobacteriota bacterium]